MPSGRPRRELVNLSLFALGAGAVAVAITVRAGLAPPIGALLVTAVVAGILEVRSVHGGDPRRIVGSWLPAALGMMGYATLETVTGPKGPDFGLAVSVTVAALGIGVGVLAVVVNAVAAVSLRLRPANGVSRGTKG